MLNLDNSDKKILSSLHRNSRSPISRISKETGLSIDIVKYGIKKLIRKRIILGFHININLSKIGYKFYMLRIHLNNFNDNLLNSVISFCERYEGLHYILMDRFSPTVEIDISMKGREDFDCFLTDLREEFFRFIVKYDLVTLTKSYGTSYLPNNLNVSFT